VASAGSEQGTNVKRHFGLRGVIEPDEIRAGGLYAIFVLVVVVVGLAFIHP